MLQKNDVVTVTAEGYTAEGNAVCRVDGFVLFVPGMLRGEQARVQLLKVKKSYGYGKIKELTISSPQRVAVECESYPSCGGCHLRHMSYEEEMELKRQVVADAFQRIGGLEIPVHPVEPSPKLTHYRNKVQLPVGRDSMGNAAVGFYAARSHRLVPCRGCLLQDCRTDRAADALLSYMAQEGVLPYDEKEHRGVVRHLYLRFSSTFEECMACVVTNSEKRLPNADLLCRLLTQALGEGVTVVQNCNLQQTNVVLGEKMIFLQGDGVIRDRLCWLQFTISPHSFFQVNHSQTERLYRKALELSGVTDRDTVLDLYCGIGTMTLLFARAAKRAIGVEIVPSAIENARENARQNHIANAEFFCGDAGLAAAKIAEKIDLLVVDPPRSGCDDALLAAVWKMAPERIIYVSCNPATLARDVQSFSQFGYLCREAFPFDMFPRTGHVETVVLLSKGGKDEI